MSQSLNRRLVAKFYRAADGNEPVNEFIQRQKPAIQLAIDRQIDRINALDEQHPHPAFPHSSQIEGELRELRCHYGRALSDNHANRSPDILLKAGKNRPRRIRVSRE